MDPSTDSDEQYPPVLRLANPIIYQNDNDNRYYQYNMNNENSENNTQFTTNSETTQKHTITTTSNVMNLKGTVTNMHPLMQIDSSPISSAPPPDLIPEKKLFTKHSSHKTHNKTPKSATSSSPKFTFQSNIKSYITNSDQLADNPTGSIQRTPEVFSSWKKESSSSDSTETEDNSNYETTVNPDLQKVSLTMIEKPKDLDTPIYRRRRLSVPMKTEHYDDDDDDDDFDSYNDLSSMESNQSLNLNSVIIRDLLENSEDSHHEKMGQLSKKKTVINEESEPIEEYSAADERRDSRFWHKITLPTGERRIIDMRVIEPYKRILSHGGYLNAGGHNAIVVFSACFLPDKSRTDYDYVMNNLFLYVLKTLDQLVTEDYVLVYLHGGGRKGSRPSFSWIKKCYEFIDWKLRKNLKKLYIVHPTIWVRTLLLLSKPFLSSKFYKKITYVHSLTDLSTLLPIEIAAIPDTVKNYEKMKLSC